jgi:hypothetical protein
VFFERLDKQFKEMDSIVSATRLQKEKHRQDSITLATEMRTAKHHHADILGIPAGVSKNALKIILGHHKIKSKDIENFIQADSVLIDSVAVTVAFYFNEKGKYNSYEIETAALKADLLDKTVRGWADRFSHRYEKKLGHPNSKARVGFHDIKQGRLSIVSRWDKAAVKVVVGLATYNNLYYAKVIAAYK